MIYSRRVDLVLNHNNTINMADASDVSAEPTKLKRKRKARYATESARKRARRATMIKRDKSRIYIKAEGDRWHKLKAESCAKSDEEFMAGVLDW